MRIKNNLLDGMEKVTDGKLYAVNICLKSGEVVHLEQLEKGEKDAYVTYVRSGKEKMLIETNKQVWRILPDDIERLDVKAYTKEQASGRYSFMRFLMVQSRINTENFTRFIAYFVLALVASIFVKLLHAGVVENSDLLNDFSVINEYMQGASELFVKISWVLAIVMIVMNIVDLFLKPSEKFYIIDEERSMWEGTKLSHILITVFCIIGFLVANQLVFGILSKLF